MPITYLDVPKGIRIEEKNKLVKAICATLHEAYPYPDDVRIFLREWRPASVSQDGQLGLNRVVLDGGLHSDNKARVRGPERGLSRRRSRAK
jgi:phenylpyruvate tautomerase PptA (4-oxalocrotonate tautomerase family)